MSDTHTNLQGTSGFASRFYFFSTAVLYSFLDTSLQTCKEEGRQENIHSQIRDLSEEKNTYCNSGII